MADNQLSILATLKTSGFKKGINEMQRSLKRFQSSDLTSMSRSLAMTSAAFTAMGVAAVKAAADVEAIETSLVSLTGGVREAGQAMSELNSFTAKTPFQLEGVAKAFRQIVAAGTAPEEATKQLQFLGDIAATTGSSIEEIAAIYSKVNAKGKVELKALNQLAERGIPIFTALSEATGLPADALGAGAVSVQQFNEVLASFAETGGFAEGAMERLSLTTAGKFSTALDNVKLAAAEVGNGLKPVADAILELTINIGQWLQQNPRLARQLGVLVGITAGVTGLAAAFLAASAAIATLGPVIAVVAAAAATLMTIYGLVDSTTDAFVTYTDAKKELESVEAAVTSEMANQEVEVKKLQAAFKTLAAEYLAAEEGGERQKELAKELIRLHPELTQYYDKETGTITNLDAAQKALNKTLKDQLETMRKTTRERLLASKLKVLEDKQTKKLAQLFEDYPRLKVSDLIIDDSGDLSLNTTGPDRVTFRMSRSEMRDLRRDVTEYNQIGDAIEAVGVEIDALPDGDPLEFDSSEYTKNLESITSAYEDTIRDIDLRIAEGVISEEDALKQRKKANEDYIETLQGLYGDYGRTVEGLQKKLEDGTITNVDEDRLAFLVDTMIPQVQNKIIQMLKATGGEADEAIAELQESLKKLQELRETAALKQRVRAEVEADLGIVDKDLLDPETRKLVEDAVNKAFSVEELKLKGATDLQLTDDRTDRNLAKDRARIAVAQDSISLIQEAFQDFKEVGSDGEDILNLSDAFNLAQSQLVTAIDTVKKLKKEASEAGDTAAVAQLQAQQDTLEDLLSQVDQATEGIGLLVVGKLSEGAGVSALADELRRGLISVDEFNASLTSDSISAYRRAIESASTAIKSGNAEVSQAAQAWLDANDSLEDYLANQVALGHITAANAEAIRQSLPAYQAQRDEWQQSRDFAESEAEKYYNGLSQMASSLSNFITGTINELSDGTRTFGEIMLETLRAIFIKVLGLIAAFTVLNLLSGGAFAASGGGFGPALGSFLKSGLSIPQFAEGGAVFGPTLALVGEKPGSRGEAIVPFEKIGQFVDQVGGGRSNHVVVSGKLRSGDIYLSGESGDNRRSRLI